MKILLTGAFGNVGISTLKALAGRGHQIRCFDLPSRTNQRLAQQHAKGLDVVWGDIRQSRDVQQAVQGQEVVLHLAAIIPALSHTGDKSEQNPSLAEAVNVGGMRNLIQAVQAMPQPAKVLFTSSVHVYGPTQHLTPPLTVSTPLNPYEKYARHKVLCEEMLTRSGLTWAVFRLSAAIPVKVVFNRAMFAVPLHNRIEYVHTLDVGLALANAVDKEALWGRVWLIGGGPRCQMTYGDMIQQFTTMLGQKPLPASLFSQQDFSVDWMDTTDSQALLGYQRHTFDDYLRQLQDLMGRKLQWVRWFNPVVRQALYLRAVLP